MMRGGIALILIGLLMAAPGLVVAAINQESTLTIAEDKSLTLSERYATSAYALNDAIVATSLQDGQLTIRAIGPGDTAVVVVTPGGSTTISVHVPAPPPSQQLGTATGSAPNESNGTLVTGYSSSGGQLSNALTLRQQVGDVIRRLSVVAATYVTSGAEGRGSIFPLLSYEVETPKRDLVLLDKSADVSPLTLHDTLVRGLFLRNGSWQFEAGASSVAQFGNYLVPANPQWVGGVSRSFGAGKHATLSANLYDIVNSANAIVSTPGGVVGSLMYDRHPTSGVAVKAEVALSRSVAYALETHYSDDKQTLDATMTEKPADFASLATDAQQGLFSTLDYARSLGPRVDLTVDAQRSAYDLPDFTDTSLSAQTRVAYRASKSVTFSAGTQYSDFNAISPSAFHTRSLSVPLDTSVTFKHVNVGFDYQPTSDLAGTHSTGYGTNLGLNEGRFSANTFYRHSENAPTIATIFSEVPGLQAALESQGITIDDPSQLAAVLANAALLSRLGFPGLKLDLAPARNDFGFDATWSPRGAQFSQYGLSILNSNAELSQGSIGFRIASLTYMRRIGPADMLNLSYGLLRTAQTSPGTPPSISQSPTFSVNLVHRISGVPRLLFPAPHGSIDGYVFRDDTFTGQFVRGAQGISGVQVRLDDGRTVRTDANGYYHFDAVAAGTHQVAAIVADTKPYIFTTDSPASATLGSEVDFGVSFEPGQLFGNVFNDAGEGIAGATVTIAGTPPRTIQTDADGHFVAKGMPAGNYTLTVDPASLPPGYDLSTLAAPRATVDTNAPQPVTITVRALRSISGHVSLYDARKGTIVPASGMEVRIASLSLSQITDENGAYVFRNLPAGSLVVSISGGTAAQQQTVAVPADPATINGIDFRVTLDQQRASRAHHTHQ